MKYSLGVYRSFELWFLFLGCLLSLVLVIIREAGLYELSVWICLAPAAIVSPLAFVGPWWRDRKYGTYWAVPLPLAIKEKLEKISNPTPHKDKTTKPELKVVK